MTTKNQILDFTLPANADLSSNQFYAVTQNASGNVAVITTGGAKALGLLQNKPDAAGRAARVATLGVAKGIAGGTIAYWEPVGPDSSGKLIVMDEEDEAVLGRSLESAVANQIFKVLITHEGSAAATSDVDAFVAAANYATTGQYLCMKAHTVAGQVIKVAAAQDDVLGILQNAPASGATALVQTYGPTTGTAGTGGFSAGDKLAVNSSGKLITATTGRACAYALAAVAEDATGAVFMVPSFLIDMTGQTLASAKMFVGNGSNVAAAVTMSGDVTNDNTGAQTIGAKKVTAAKMYSAARGTIFRTDASNAVSELSLADGKIAVGDGTDVAALSAKTSGQILVGNGTTLASVAVSQDATLAANGALSVSDLTIASEAQGDLLRRGAAAWERVAAAGDGYIMVGDGTDVNSVAVSGDVALTNAGVATVTDLTIASEARGDIIRRGAAAWERHDAKTDGQILVGDGTDIVSVAVSGDMALANTGAVTIAKTFIRQLTTTWSVAQVKAGNVTPLVLADFSALSAAGTVAAGDALIFHGVVANVYQGAASYDQNENSIIKYQTAGGGATVSTTLANWFNGAVDGAITTIKPITTDIVPEINEDLVWTMSASPFNAAGDRLLSVTLYYSVFTPAT